MDGFTSPGYEIYLPITVYMFTLQRKKSASLKRFYWRGVEIQFFSFPHGAQTIDHHDMICVSSRSFFI